MTTPAPCSNAGHPGNDYYVSPLTGEIQRVSGWSRFLYSGWNGPFDWCGAKAFAAGHTVSGIAHSTGTVTKYALCNIGQSLTNGLLPENFLMRAGEVLIGLILLGIGLNTLLKNTPVGDAAKTVTKAVPVPV